MITIKTEKEIQTMREGGKILANILRELGRRVRPGMTTAKLEMIACDMIEKAGGRPAFKGYRTSPNEDAFPTALCTSINDEIVHAPSLPSREIKSGDIIGIDVGMEYPYKKGEKGMYTDSAITVPVGEVDKKVSELIRVTKRALDIAIEQVRPGNSLNDIGKAIEDYIDKTDFSIVRDLVGHGVGREVHEEPQIPNYSFRDNSFVDVVLEPGMTIAIEPMINMGSYGVRVLSDGFTFVTDDGELSAHFEHTIAVTKKGCEVLTK